jgi:hypothetical protein
MSPKKAYTFLIEPELERGLKALKVRDGIAEAEAIRRAILQFLREKGIAIEGDEKAPRKRALTRKRG